MATSRVGISGPTSVSAGSRVVYTVKDGNGNTPPTGMTFSISGQAKATLEESKVPNTVGCGDHGYQVAVDIDGQAKSGNTFQIVATSPAAKVATKSPVITVQ